MSKWLKVVALLLMTTPVVATAEIRHVANQQYDFAGMVEGRAVAHCGPLAMAQGLPSADNTFSVLFGPSDDVGAAFQIVNDNLMGAVTDVSIVDRKKNKLVILYAGTTTELESGEKLKGLIIQKASDHGVNFGADLSVKRYKNRIYIDRGALRFVEKVTILVPHYPRSQCNTTIYGKRALTGYLHVDPPSPG